MNYFKPVKKEHNNFVWSGGNDDVDDLHGTKIAGSLGLQGTASIWKIEHVEARKKFLETGEITLMFYGTPPPSLLYLGDYCQEMIDAGLRP